MSGDVDVISHKRLDYDLFFIRIKMGITISVVCAILATPAVVYGIFAWQKHAPRSFNAFVRAANVAPMEYRNVYSGFHGGYVRQLVRV